MKIKKNIKIGIIGALNEEIIFLRQKIKYLKKTKVHSQIFYTGQLNCIDIILTKSGVGKVSASITCTMLLNLYKIDLIINVGTAGSLDIKLVPGSIVLPNNTCYHDVNLTAFGYELGQIQKLPQLFSANNYMIRLTEICMLKSNIYYNKNLIISGDSFINKKKYKKILKERFPTAIAVDMESTAIAQVCYQFKKPLLIIKSISDYSDNYALSNFKEFSNLASKQFSKITQNILKNLYKKIITET
ncbi:MAG: 5'-methylthioadenosine/adenosylhomocysteine nucleosidase [Buchnera aphidicola (Kaburagia rhusicola rhusicola)]